MPRRVSSARGVTVGVAGFVFKAFIYAAQARAQHQGGHVAEGLAGLVRIKARKPQPPGGRATFWVYTSGP